MMKMEIGHSLLLNLLVYYSMLVEPFLCREFIRREGLIPHPSLAGFYMRNLLFGKSIFVLGMKPYCLNPFLAEPTCVCSAPEWLIGFWQILTQSYDVDTNYMITKLS
ncbi:MAG: hypothetical protein PQJ46_02160 [Spirochaetales bacterium]|nr:hypothetical protein [Spirochaetales bacterium]